MLKSDLQGSQSFEPMSVMVKIYTSICHTWTNSYCIYFVDKIQPVRVKSGKYSLARMVEDDHSSYQDTDNRNTSIPTKHVIHCLLLAIIQFLHSSLPLYCCSISSLLPVVDNIYSLSLFQIIGRGYLTEPL